MEHQAFHRFLTVWSSQLLSVIGSGLTGFALGVYVFERTQTATSAALAILLSFLPSTLLWPIGGVLADRLDRRLIMAVSDLGAALGPAFILAVMLFGEPELRHIYIGVTASSVFAGFHLPAYKATVTDLLAKEQYSKGSGLIQLAESSRYLLSPFLAGILLTRFNIETVLAVDIGTFTLACLTILMVRRRMKPPAAARAGRSWQADLLEGWQAILMNRGVLLLILVISLVTFFLGFLQTLIGPMVLSFADARTLGAIQSTCAVGMLLSSLLIGMFSVGRRYVDLLTAGLAAAGVALSLLGLTTNVYFITGAGFLFLAALPVVNMSCDVLVRSNIPGEQQGRVWGFVGILSQLGFIAAYALSGPLADRVFNPLLAEDGLLASSVGRWIGTGPGRGIGLLFMLCGMMVVVLALIIPGIRPIRDLARHAAGTGAGKDG
jgi:Major Facilitator Superfamily.